MSKVVIIGGGIIGLNCAYYLQKEGYDVTVIDHGNITDGCSFGNMGYISPSHFTPIATPGIISQGLKWMLKSSSPFYIKPRLNMDLIRWGMSFWKSANATKMAENIPHLNNLLQLSRSLMVDIKQDLSDSFDMIEKGCWMLYKQKKTGEHEKYLADEAEQMGLKTIICNAQQVQQYETQVEVNVAGGVLYLDDCHINSRKLMQGLHTYLQNKGVTFYLNSEVKSFERSGDKISGVIINNQLLTFDELVIANGSWMQQLSKSLGLYVPLQPGKGYSIMYDNLENNLQYPSILVDDRTATTPIEKWLRIGGTMELSGHSDNILDKRVMAVYNAFNKYYPSMKLSQPDIKKAWFGYRPISPDGMPYIGRHKSFKNLVFAGAHAMLGVSAAAATGKLVKEIVSHQSTTINIEAFNPDRFN